MKLAQKLLLLELLLLLLPLVFTVASQTAGAKAATPAAAASASISLYHFIVFYYCSIKGLIAVEQPNQVLRVSVPWKFHILV